MDRLRTAVLPAVLLAGLAHSDARAQESAPAGAGASSYEVSCRFDFDERPRGNFEDVPMYWVRLEGDGLPRYSAATFDDEVGHDAAPSVRFQVQGGSIVQEYQGELNLDPRAEHVVSGYVRASGLRHARAFIHGFYVDALGAAVPGTDCISELVGAPTAADANDWRRVTLRLPACERPGAQPRLRLWVLQPAGWADVGAVDPIDWQDVRATVWFDDLEIHRLPGARLRVAAVGGLLKPDTPVRLQAEVIAPGQSVHAELSVTDVSGRLLHETSCELPDPGGPMETTVSGLAPGLYVADLVIRSAGEELLQRTTTFAILGPVLAPPAARTHFGITIPAWEPGDDAGLCELVSELGCGCVKFGLPDPHAAGNDGIARLAEVGRVARSWLGRGLQMTGILPAESVPGLAGEAGPELKTSFGPALALLGNVVSRWQLGLDHQVQEADRSAAVIEARRQLAEFVAGPQVVLPRPILAVGAGGPVGAGFTAWNVDALWLTPEVPTQNLVAHLGPILNTGAQWTPYRPVWVSLSSAPPDIGREMRIADLARRIVLARAAGVDQVYVRAPMAQASGGAPGWFPTEDFIPLRTLFHTLANGEAAGVIPLPDADGLGIIFLSAGEDLARIVLWTWRNEPSAPVPLYVGTQAILTELNGGSTPVEASDGRAWLSLTPTPVVLQQVDAGLALLQASFTLGPTFVEAHAPEQGPTLRLRNPYEQLLIGEIRVGVPEDWRVAPVGLPFQLQPGQDLECPLRLTLPPNVPALAHPVAIELVLHAPTVSVLRFDVPITVGLREIDVQAAAHWESGDLVIEQTVRNLSEAPVSFTGVCRVPQRPPLEAAFLDVAPGEMRPQVYCFPGARGLAGAAAQVSVREIRGRRALDQLVELPR